MTVRSFFLVVLGLAGLLASVGLAADPPGADDWKYDVVHRKKGLALRGLVVEQTPNQVTVKCISRKPGSPTLVFTEFVPRSDIARLDLLPGKDREQLQQRLEGIKKEREVLAGHLRSLDPKVRLTNPSGDALDLRPNTLPDGKTKALSYESTYFRLLSSSRAEVVQLAAIQLEQIYAAYARALPPRTPTAEPTTILLTRSIADYQGMARERGLELFNPAFYDTDRNQVLCGSDLQRLSDELEKVRGHHLTLRGNIKDRRAELFKVYRGKVPLELLTPLGAAESRIALAERRNEETFKRARDRLFTRLYHEAFHAYLGTFVYPDKDGALPLWFNEGLAQIFETAIVEVGELRVGHADEVRLRAVRLALAKGELLPLTDLLRSGSRQFVVAHASDQQVSDRYYLASWALSFYLTFDQKLLGTPALDEYVGKLKRGTDPLLAFRDLVGKPLSQFEKEYLGYLKALRPDGSTGK